MSLEPAISTTSTPGPGLSARSVIASTLLGTHPPRLRGGHLAAFAELFGIRPGTARVALSRMVDAGELVRTDRGYELAGALLQRQARQAEGLRPRQARWEGSWEMVVVRAGAREAGDRSALRRACGHLGLGELREGVWMRPDNLAPDRLATDRAVVADQADAFRVVPDGDPTGLVARVFDLEAWAGRAVELGEAMVRAEQRLVDAGAEALAPGFVVAADVLRHLVADPLLPAEIAPPHWPDGELRAAYRSYDAVYRAQLSAFLRSVDR